MEGCLRRRIFCLRGTQSILLRLRVEFGDNVAWLDNLPHIDSAADHPAIDAEGEAFFGARADMAGERHRFAFGVAGRDDGPNRSGVRRRRGRRAAGREQSQAQPDKSRSGFHGRPRTGSSDPIGSRSVDGMG